MAESFCFTQHENIATSDHHAANAIEIEIEIIVQDSYRIETSCTLKVREAFQGRKVGKDVKI